MDIKRSIPAIAMFPGAQVVTAPDTPYDVVACTHSKHTLVEANNDIAALGKGVCKGLVPSAIGPAKSVYRNLS